MMEGYSGVLSTVILAAVIGFFTFRGFRREAANLKNGTCCGSESSCCNCSGNCQGSSCHTEDAQQSSTNTKKPGDFSTR
ncbi:hypothetical protein SAMN05660649_00829 [Desulfotomaculum arcticum]|uniref:Uncharacterized protein n=1 Tax=Desulfotruncus arcticus DSM 17038 TaxID=1121424 RepID=A0A1I2PJC1_9FIRM|nr:hypothetical protein [Desulfotruncus arcticus]SFG13746.1 hypothetical protein SAMN05660649_00829 [Desulfotomaculum arcticum] [Desulfotruncus arcticus DSM 17038]